MRRAFRRQMRRGFAPDIPPILQRANVLLNKGEYAEAALAFEQMARAAELRGGPRAPVFFLQAGQARLLANQNAAGIESLKHGLELLAERGAQARLAHIGPRVIAQLDQHGLSKEAAELNEWLKSQLPAGSAAPAPEVARKPILPTHCPACGAPVRSDEVEWLDELTAECAFCGSPVRGEA
jgi:hypothetical protein